MSDNKNSDINALCQVYLTRKLSLVLRVEINAVTYIKLCVVGVQKTHKEHDNELHSGGRMLCYDLLG